MHEARWGRAAGPTGAAACVPFNAPSGTARARSGRAAGPPARCCAAQRYQRPISKRPCRRCIPHFPRARCRRRPPPARRTTTTATARPAGGRTKATAGGRAATRQRRGARRSQAPPATVWSARSHTRRGRIRVAVDRDLRRAVLFGVLLRLGGGGAAHESGAREGAAACRNTPIAGLFGPVSVAVQYRLAHGPPARAVVTHATIAVFPILADAVDVKRGDQLCETVCQPSIQPDKVVRPMGS